ncbi:hypothetical protein CYMTET_52275 [Cymbomonas tetramitiformis]|uniref:GHMP kinase N-terminal domain-containing protein n=1 Tax=Cymbomonas tetramitiformis TaxID=36881 RepID=A0AAE0BKS8_9CHLO|nr:hypothetical protein CYMTET_52275 [Cymbomonas tetramitiformis]
MHTPKKRNRKQTRHLSVRSTGNDEPGGEVDWVSVAREMQAEAEARLNSAGERKAGSGQVEVEYNPQQKFRDMEREAAGVETNPQQLTLFSPAKIDLFTRITGNSADGAAELAKLTHTIDIGDTLKFSLSPSPKRDSLTTNSLAVPLDETNSIKRALALFRERTGETQHFWIHLTKTIPEHTELGGDASNAATALWAANEMCGTELSAQTLQEWAAELGDDCAAFFSEGATFSSVADGMSKMTTALSQEKPFLLVAPKVDVTRDAILEGAQAEEGAAPDTQKLLADFATGEFGPTSFQNDLEPAVFAKSPLMKFLKKRLAMEGKDRFEVVFVSGAGSVIVCWGAVDAPTFLYEDDEHEDTLVLPARLLTREEGKWFSCLNRGSDGDSEANVPYGEGLTGEEWLEQAGIKNESGVMKP